MVKKEEEKTFMVLAKEFPFLNKLSLKSFYSILSSLDESDSYYGESCSRYTKDRGSDNCDLRYLCIISLNMLTKILMTIYAKKLDSSIKFLEHLFYWMYDYIKSLKPCGAVDKLYNELYTWKKNNLPNDSSVINDFRITEADFIKKRDLFLHSEILYWIEKTPNGVDGNDLTQCKEYIDKCANIYNKINCNDSPAIKKSYEKELNNFSSNFNNAISFLKQKSIITKEEEELLKNKLMCQSKSPKDQEGDSGERVEAVGEKAQLVSGGPQGQEGLTVPVGPGMERPLASEGEGDLVGESITVTEVSGHHSEAIMPQKIGTIGATLAGSSLFLLMIYKYTPFGSWVNTRIIGKDKLMDSMKKNNYELLLNDIGNHEASLNDTMYHIRYNTSLNQ